MPRSFERGSFSSSSIFMFRFSFSGGMMECQSNQQSPKGPAGGVP
jgi:hypothetical protein